MNYTLCASYLFYFWHHGYFVDIKVGPMGGEFDLKHSSTRKVGI